MRTRLKAFVGLVAVLALSVSVVAACANTEAPPVEGSSASTTTAVAEQPQTTTSTTTTTTRTSTTTTSTTAPPEPTSVPPPPPGPCGGPAPTEPADFDAALKSVRSEGWVTGDLLDRVKLDETRYLWVFADSFYGELADDGAFLPGWYLVNSSAVVQNQDCFELVEVDGRGSWIPEQGPGQFMWPQEGLVIDETLNLFAMDVVDARAPTAVGEELRRLADTDDYWLRFRVVGGRIVLFSLDNLSVPTTAVPGLPHVRGNPFGWGAFIHDDYIYLYAHEEETGTYAGRLDPEQIQNPASMTFWDGEAWTSDLDQVVSVAPNRLRVFPHKDGFGAAALPHNDQQLHLYTSETPVGPWTLRDQVSLDAIHPDVPCYIYEPLVIERPVVDPDSNEVLFAVNFLPLDPQDWQDDANRYGPRFLTVELPGWSEP